MFRVGLVPRIRIAAIGKCIVEKSISLASKTSTDGLGLGLAHFSSKVPSIERLFRERIAALIPNDKVLALKLLNCLSENKEDNLKHPTERLRSAEVEDRPTHGQFDGY